MIGQILKTGIAMLLISLGCKQGKSITQKISKEIIVPASKDTIVVNLNNKEYSLRIETYFVKDTLDVVDYKEERYSSPIITFQKLLFYDKNELVKDHKLPLKSVRKRDIKGNILNATETPIYKMCLSKNLYIVHGSDYCNGSECREFTGIYSVNGDVLYEGFSNETKKNTFENVVRDNDIELNKLSDCVNIDIFKR